jgi:hypothetical protein
MSGDRASFGRIPMGLQERIHASAILSVEDVDQIFQRALRDVEMNPFEHDKDGKPVISISVLQCRVGYYAEQTIQYAQQYVDLGK